MPCSVVCERYRQEGAIARARWDSEGSMFLLSSWSQFRWLRAVPCLLRASLWAPGRDAASTTRSTASSRLRDLSAKLLERTFAPA